MWIRCVRKRVSKRVSKWVRKCVRGCVKGCVMRVCHERVCPRIRHFSWKFAVMWIAG